MKYFTIFALTLLIIFAMEANAKDKHKPKDDKGEGDKGKNKKDKDKEDEEKKDDDDDSAKGGDDKSRRRRSDAKECKKDCPKKLIPVCGYNEKCYEVFDDKCELVYENCKKDESFTEVKINMCANLDNTMCEDDD